MTSDDLHNEHALLTRVARGDEPAFRRLFDLYRARLYAFVVQLTHSKADAEEIVQEVFMKLWEHREQLVRVEQPGKYIYTIARNKTLNHLAKAAREKKLEHQLWVNLSTSANDTDAILEAGESRRLIHEALSSLSGQKQEVFRLSREEGLSHEAIALKMGLSKSRVNNLLVEILKYIKDYLHGHSPMLAIVFYMTYGRLFF